MREHIPAALYRKASGVWGGRCICNEEVEGDRHRDVSRLLGIHTGDYRPPLRKSCWCGRRVQVLRSDTREGKFLLRCPTCDKTPQQCRKDSHLHRGTDLGINSFSGIH